MRSSYHKSIVMLIITVFFLLSTGCMSITNSNSQLIDKSRKFLEIRDSIDDCLKQLGQEKGIIITGLASDSEQFLIKIGVGIDRSIITDIRLKELVQKYIGNIPKEMIEPYHLQIEEINKEEGKTRLIGEKISNSKVIRWFD